MKVYIKVNFIGVKHVIDHLTTTELTNYLSYILKFESRDLLNYWASINANKKQIHMLRKWLLEKSSDAWAMSEFMEWWIRTYPRNELSLEGFDYDDNSIYMVHIPNCFYTEESKTIRCDIIGFEKFLKGQIKLDNLSTIALNQTENYQKIITKLKELEDK